MNVVLCGLPGSGKSTVGRLLAHDLSCSFFDTDTLLESLYLQRTGRARSCREIFRKEGEYYFRRLEKEAVLSFQPSERCVIALGGGWVEKSVKKFGTVVHLKASLQVLLERACREGIPAYLDPSNLFQSFEALAHKRIPLYQSLADKELDTENLLPKEAASLLLKS